MKLAVYSTKQYDKKYLQQVNESFGFELEFFDFLLTEKTAKTANGCEAVCIFVNDDGSRPVLEELKKQNIWTYASDMNGESLYNVNFSGGCALVIGAEGQGVSRLVRETCDTVVSIPMKGHIDSLNASVAAGILMAEVARHRG